MFFNLQSLITLVTLSATVAILIKPADADQFHAQILSAAGSKILLSVSPSQGYSGSITFAASNVENGTNVYLQGNAEPLPLIGAPPGVSVTLYSILLNFDPKYASQFATTGPSTLKLGLPATVNTSKPLSVYETQFITTPPQNVVWSGPFVGSVAGGICSFSLPSLSFPGNYAVVFYITQ